MLVPDSGVPEAGVAVYTPHGTLEVRPVGLTVLMALLPAERMASQPWFIFSIGSVAICAASLLALLLEPPHIQWRRSLPRWSCPSRLGWR